MENKNKKFKQWPIEAKTGLGLTICAGLIIGGVLIFGKNDIPTDDPSNESEINNPIDPVDDPIETLMKPFKIDAQISHYYYDNTDDSKQKMLALVPVPNKSHSYVKSVGVDYSYKDPFDVIAACSGTVIDRKTDSVYGNVLYIEHETGITTVYSSLSEFNVAKGDKIKQGAIIGQSGQSLYTTGIDNALHFELIKNGNYINPEKSYTVAITSI